MINGVTDVESVVRRPDRGAAAADRRLRSNDCRGVGGRARGWRQVGKSRLVAELAKRATAAGAVVVTGHCLDVAEGGAPSPRRSTRFSPNSVTTPAPAPGRRRRYRPPCAEPRPAKARRAHRRGRPLGRPIDPRSAHRACRRARAAPHVARRHLSHRQPGAWQPDSRPARRARSRRARGAPPPRPFGPGDVAERRGILGSQPPDWLVSSVLERSDGNPFFAEELAAVSEQGTSRRAP